MATYLVWSGGNNSSGTEASGWANAYQAYGSAVTAAGTSGDIIKVHKAHTEDLAADTTYTFTANVNTICVDKDASDAPAVMTGYIGHATLNRFITIAGAFKLYFYGLLLQIAGTAADDFTLSGTDGQSCIYESCTFKFTNNQGGSDVNLGGVTPGGVNVYVELKNCTLYISNAGQGFACGGGKYVLIGLTVTGSVAGPDTLFDISGLNSHDGQMLECVGCDFSNMSSDTLLSDTIVPTKVTFAQCKFGSTTTVHTALSSVTNKGGLEVWVNDCATDGTNGLFGYYNVFGNVISDTTIKLTAGAAGQSWKITTTDKCSVFTPFETPWISLYHTDTAAIEPYFEFLRNNDGTTTPYDNDEVWIDVMAKTVSSTSQQSALFTDRMTLLGTPVAQTSSALGAGDWASESGTCAYGVIKAPSLTPAEAGHIMARVCVGIEIAGKLHVDPQIRT